MHVTTVCYNVWNNNGQDEWTYSIAEAMAMYADWSTTAPDTVVSLYIERDGSIDHARWLHVHPITEEL